MRLPIATALLLAACSGPKPDAPAVAPTGAGSPTPAATPPAATPIAPTAAAKREAEYVGRWTGVEGMYLVVSGRPGGGVSLRMQYDLDNKGTFPGSVTAEGLRFTRNGVAELARPTDGGATGLKYLAGKKDCLTVKPGEGYCRD